MRIVAAHSISDLPFEPTNCIYLPLTVEKWHKHTENAQETVGPVFLAGGLPCLCPFEPLLDAELAKGASLKCWNNNPCDFVDLLLEKPLVAKLPAVPREELDRCRG
jgi:hypothetical protein